MRLHPLTHVIFKVQSEQSLMFTVQVLVLGGLVVLMITPELDGGTLGVTPLHVRLSSALTVPSTCIVEFTAPFAVGEQVSVDVQLPPAAIVPPLLHVPPVTA